MKKFGRIISSSLLSMSLMFSSCTIISAESMDDETSDSLTAQKIIEFIDYSMDMDQPFMTLKVQEGIKENEIDFPEVLMVNIDGIDGAVEMPVTWQTNDDFDNTNNEKYIFTPVWDETKYELSSELQVNEYPYIEVIKEYVENISNEIPVQTFENTQPIEVTIGNGGEYKDFSKLFAAEDIKGEVIVKLTGDVADSDFVIPEKITSLTIQSNQEGTQRGISVGNATESIYVNGSKFITSKDIKLEVSGVYGGNYQKDTTGSPHIEIYGQCKGSIYGGGYHADLTGNPTIVFGGQSVTNIVGGGNATADDIKNAGITANVNGSVSITLKKDSFAKSIYGGGYIVLNTTSYVGSTFTAKVSGDVTLNIDGKLGRDARNLISITGGGYARVDSKKDTTMNVDVGGNILIDLGQNARGESKPIGLVGGGYAWSNSSSSIPNQSNIQISAKVGGNIRVTAVSDSLASSSQEDYQKFQFLYGGGYANGRGADATVSGDTFIESSRGMYDSDSALCGGGYAECGATADIRGTTHIEVKSMSNQSDSYLNAKAIWGGGKAVGSYDNANSIFGNKTSQANVGGVVIKIEPGVQFENGVKFSILGGGYVDGFTSDDSSFNKCSAEAKVLGNIEIKIGDNITLTENLCNAGYVSKSGNASVSGSINVTAGKNLKIGDNYIGGGYAVDNNIVSNSIADVTGKITVIFEDNVEVTDNDDDNKNNKFIAAGYATSTGASANVEGGIDYEINGNLKCYTYYGGGYASAADSNANIGTEYTKNQDIIKTVFKGNGSNAITLSGNNWIYNGSFSGNRNANTNIYGNISLNFDGTSPKNIMVLSSAIGDETIYGSINLYLKNITISKSLYAGSYVYGNANSCITGDITSKFEGVRIEGKIYNGPNNRGTAKVEGNVKLILTDSTISNDIYSGGYELGIKSDITGKSIIEINGGNTFISTGKIYSGGTNKSTVDKVEYYITGIQKTPMDLFGKGGGTITNGTDVYVGDGTTETNIECVRLSNISKLIINNDAEIKQSEYQLKGGVNKQSMLSNVTDVEIKSGGTLNLVNKEKTFSPETIKGSFVGGGKLILNNNLAFKITNTASGTTDVEILGDPKQGQEYILVNGGGDELFNYIGDGYQLVKEDKESSGHVWKLGEFVQPVNNVTGIKAEAEYTQGDKIIFSAVGEGMNNETPQQNDVRWLPVSWSINESKTFDTGNYTGKIDTNQLDPNSYTLTVTFKKQIYTSDSWVETNAEDSINIPFKVKAKSSGGNTPSGGGSSGGSSIKKEDGFVENKNNTYYYKDGKPVESGFILLDKDAKLIATVSPDQFTGELEAVYYIKEDKTVAKHEWVVLDKNGKLVKTMPLQEAISEYGEEYKIYAAREDGKLVQSWLEIEGVWYYFLEDYTARYQYWQAHWNDWYLFENYTYVCNRWIPTSEGRWYYVNAEGKMVSNQWVDGYWIDEYGIYWSPLYSQE